MRNFKPAEFREWWSLMDPRLLGVLDRFRDDWGARVDISPHSDALGRRLGPDSNSQHNVNVWRTVRAADIFPQGLSEDEFPRAYDCAKSAGATGIGFYTDTHPGPMMHLDVRRSHTPDRPATWSRIKGRYLGLSHAMPEGWKI